MLHISSAPGPAASSVGGKQSGRSRTGCLSCKKRRRKCDESRPSCNNCVSTGQTCIYSAMLPLRERRAAEKGHALPGEQTPWAATIPAAKGPSEATSTRSSDHVLMSSARKARKNSFQCHSLANNVEPSLVFKASHDEDVLDNIGLITTWRQAYATGSMRGFEVSFYSHKVRSLQKVRKWIEDKSEREGGTEAALRVVRSIATHCLVELALGNTTEARIHQRGLLILADHLGLISSAAQDDQEGLMHRFIVLTVIVLQGLHSIGDDDHKHPPASTAGTAASTITQSSQDKKAADGATSFEVLARVPFFYVVPANYQPRLFDVRHLLGACDGINEYTDGYQPPGTAKESRSRNQVFSIRLLDRLLSIREATLTKQRNGRGKEQRQEQLVDHICPLLAVILQYSGVVLSLWDPSVTENLTIMQFLGHAIKRDLAVSCDTMQGQNAEAQRYWLWKAFVTALSLHLRAPADRPQEFMLLELQIRMFVKRWSVLTGVTAWEDAREALESIAWPKYPNLEEEASSVWAACVAKSELECSDSFQE